MQSTTGRPMPASGTHGKRRPYGFTLVELMVTVVVLAIVVTIAAPGFTGMINRNRLTASANQIVAAMQTARMEAIRRNTRVMLCPSTDGTTCAGGDWSRVIVFADANGNFAPGDKGDEVVRDFVVADGDVLAVKASSNTATNQRIGFAADGLARVGNAGAREGGISVCSTDLAPTANTLDITVAVSRIGVSQLRNGTSACTALTD